MRLDPKDFKIRCSTLGQIMTEPRGGSNLGKYNKLKESVDASVAKYTATANKETKTAQNLFLKIGKDKIALQELGNIKDLPNLSATAKTYCKKWLKFYEFGRKRPLVSKYLTKGITQEEEGFKLICEVLDLGMVFKNEESAEDGYSRGTSDLNLSDTIIDNKCSWDLETFPAYENFMPDAGYEWQIRGYMELYNKPKGKLIYTLVDTPQHLIESEAKRFCFQMDETFTEAIYNEFEHNMTYGDIEPSKRVKVFNIERKEDTAELIRNRVIECRNYIESIINYLK